mmetsp:Transcript_13241/g.38506  ORF Transcript_13241/g.38506 Transcript_13241/m.38506 type:complete len:520 (+) Transcript_13241:1985-3544(+)
MRLPVDLAVGVWVDLSASGLRVQGAPVLRQDPLAQVQKLEPRSHLVAPDGVPLGELVKCDRIFLGALSLVKDECCCPDGATVRCRCQLLRREFQHRARDRHNHLQEGPQEPPEASPGQAPRSRIRADELPGVREFVALVPGAEERKPHRKFHHIDAPAFMALKGHEKGGEDLGKSSGFANVHPKALGHILWGHQAAHAGVEALALQEPFLGMLLEESRHLARRLEVHARALYQLSKSSHITFGDGHLHCKGWRKVERNHGLRVQVTCTLRIVGGRGPFGRVQELQPRGCFIPRAVVPGPKRVEIQELVVHEIKFHVDTQRRADRTLVHRISNTLLEDVASRARKEGRKQGAEHAGKSDLLNRILPLLIEEAEGEGEFAGLGATREECQAHEELTRGNGFSAFPIVGIKEIAQEDLHQALLLVFQRRQQTPHCTVELATGQPVPLSRVAELEDPLHLLLNPTTGLPFTQPRQLRHLTKEGSILCSDSQQHLLCDLKIEGRSHDLAPSQRQSERSSVRTSQ